VEKNRISSLQSHGKALEKECCLIIRKYKIFLFLGLFYLLSITVMRVTASLTTQRWWLLWAIRKRAVLGRANKGMGNFGGRGKHPGHCAWGSVWRTHWQSRMAGSVSTCCRGCDHTVDSGVGVASEWSVVHTSCTTTRLSQAPTTLPTSQMLHSHTHTVFTDFWIYSYADTTKMPDFLGKIF